MTLRQHKIFIYILTQSLNPFACSVTEVGLSKKRIVINRNHNNIYKIQVPPGDTGISKFYGYHGHHFGVGYPDSSFIYYINDSYVATPNGFENYKLVGYVTPIGGLKSDTVIGGLQPDGTYWTEIFHDGYYIGYKNVPKERLELFDKSLKTFRRTK